MHYFYPKWDEIGWEREKKKKICPEFCSYPTRARKFQKNKNRRKIQKSKKKTSFRHYLYPKRDEIDREREKKFLVPNSIPNRPDLENSKKTAKKFKKLKNIVLALFLSKLDDIGRERKKKILVQNSVPTRPELENSKK